MRNRKHTKLIGLFFLFGVLLNYPILYLFGQGGTTWGIPTLVFSLFTLWLLLIIALRMVVDSKSTHQP